LGFTITGSAETVKSFDRPLLAEHHLTHYTQANSVLVFSGQVERERSLLLAERAFHRLPQGQEIAVRPPIHAQKKPRLRVVANQSSQTELRVCFRAFGEHAPERPAIDMLLRIIDDGMSTRLYHRICDAQGLC